MTVAVNVSSMRQIQIVCVGANSCASSTISIYSKRNIDLNLLCFHSHSCREMAVDLHGSNSGEYLSATVICHDSNSCRGLDIDAVDFPQNIGITVNATLWSEGISIHSPHPENVAVICGSNDDHRYIEFDIDRMMNDDEMLAVARQEYGDDGGRLPCEGITVYCSDESDSRHKCVYEYDLNFNLKSMFNSTKWLDLETVDCYWLDLGDIRHTQCKGTCNGDSSMFLDVSRYRQQHESLHLNITFNGSVEHEDTNKTTSFVRCQTYFGTEEDTGAAIRNIDVILDHVLDMITASHSAIASSTFPISYRRNQRDCVNEDINVIQLITNFTIDTLENDTLIADIFDPNGVFHDQAQDLLSDYFRVSVVFGVQRITTEIENGVSKSSVALLVMCICSLCLGIMFLIQRRNRLKWEKMEKKTIRIRNPMVIPIGIGDYSHDVGDIMRAKVGKLTDLPCVRKDVEKAIEFFKDELNYDIFPDYLNDQQYYVQLRGDSKKYVKADWSKSELTDFLFAKSQFLAENRESQNEGVPSYDALIVSISCHGYERGIFTADYRKILKEDIYRIFTSNPTNRNIPRIFIFDSCSGFQEQHRFIREDLNEERKRWDEPLYQIEGSASPRVVVPRDSDWAIKEVEF